MNYSQKQKLVFSFITFFLIFNNTLFSQAQYCGTKGDFKKATLNAKSTLKNLEIIPDDTTIYTIPVVFIIYHLGEPEGTGYNLLRESIDTALANLNNWYRAKVNTAQSNGIDTKIQFAYALRSPSNVPINGIIRVDASGNNDYVNNASSYENYQLASYLRALTPEYNSSATSNGIVIRIVKSVAPWAGYAYYFGDTFVDFNNISGNYILPHEIGHILGIRHTFEGSYLDSNTGFYTCPSNNDPNNEGDGINDTDPHKLSDNGCNRELDINSCTGLPFSSLLKNTMSYSYCSDRFSNGQIYRMRYNLVNNYLGNILNPVLLSDEIVTPASCSITLGPEVSPFFYLIHSFSLNTIHTVGRAALFSFVNPNMFYTDYTRFFKTDLTANSIYLIQIEGTRYTKFYIDYNDDGEFNETNELLLNNVQGINHSITISNSSVKNKYLRARVVSSYINSHTACFLPSDLQHNYGEIEDYGIKILPAILCTAMESVKSGNWNDPLTWSCNRVPTQTDDVTISPEHIISVPSGVFQVKSVTYTGGTLNLENGAELKIEN